MRAAHTPRRSRGGHVTPMVGIPLPLWIAGILAGAVWRFFAGQVVLRRPSRFDSRFLTPAPELPERAELGRTEGIPRSAWAKRPGYQRLAVRLGGLTALIGYLTWPTATTVLAVLLAAAWAARVGWRLHQDAYYQRVLGGIDEFLERRLEWEGRVTHARQWVTLPSYRAELVQVAPLRSALLPADEHTGESGGWLFRWAPSLAARLEPLARPIGDWRLIRWATCVSDGRPAWLAVVLRRAARRLVWLVEASREWRAYPRVVTPDLSEDDTEITFRYAPTYQANSENLHYVEDHLKKHLPRDRGDDTDPATDVGHQSTVEVEGTWKLKVNHQNRTLTAYHPVKLPKYVPWTHEKFAEFDILTSPFGVILRGSEQKLAKVDCKHATPHVNLTGKTLAGKTITFLVIVGCRLYHGGYLVMIDPKQVDFVLPFRGLRNVELVTVEADFPRWLENVFTEMERRYSIIKQYAVRSHEAGMPVMQDNPELYFQPLTLGIDEMSGFKAICDAWWRREGGGYDDDGEPIPGKPANQPVTTNWIRALAARARACGIYLVAAAQQNGIPYTFPDVDVRGNFQYKIFSGPPDGPGWRATFPGEHMRKLRAQCKGRGTAGFGADLFETQLAYMPWQEIRKAAQHGEEVMDAENRKRAERLAELTGEPLWTVSPLPWWVPVPAETAPNVPGQDTSRDTPAAELPDRPGPALHAVPGGAGESAGHADDEADDGASEVIAEVIDETPDESNTSSSADNGESNTSSSDARTGDRFVVARTEPERLNGHREAAALLGVEVDTLRRAITRAQKRGEQIPGMHKDGQSVIYDDPRQLREWWNQRPGTGRKAS